MGIALGQVLNSPSGLIYKFKILGTTMASSTSIPYNRNSDTWLAKIYLSNTIVFSSIKVCLMRPQPIAGEIHLLQQADLN